MTKKADKEEEKKEMNNGVKKLRTKSGLSCGVAWYLKVTDHEERLKRKQALKEFAGKTPMRREIKKNELSNNPALKADHPRIPKLIRTIKEILGRELNRREREEILEHWINDPTPTMDDERIYKMMETIKLYLGRYPNAREINKILEHWFRDLFQLVNVQRKLEMLNAIRQVLGREINLTERKQILEHWCSIPSQVMNDEEKGKLMGTIKELMGREPTLEERKKILVFWCSNFSKLMNHERKRKLMETIKEILGRIPNVRERKKIMKHWSSNPSQAMDIKRKSKFMQTIEGILGRKLNTIERMKIQKHWNRHPSRVVTNISEDQSGIICQKNLAQGPSKEIEEPLISDLPFTDNLEGMVVLGRISEIQELYLVVDLPGTISGIVPVTNISKEFASNLKSFIIGENQEYPCEKYHIGQFVLARIESLKKIRKKESSKNKREEKKRKASMEELRKVYELTKYDKAVLQVRLQETLQQLQIKRDNEGRDDGRLQLPQQITPIVDMSVKLCTSIRKEVILSMRPEDVNFELLSVDFKVGLFVAATVCSIEDNVYVMNCGVTDVRAYLSKGQSLKYEKLYCNGKPLAVGQVLLCVVISSSFGDTSDLITVSLSLDPELMAKSHPPNVKIKHVPGMIYDVTISESTEKGVIVKFSSGKKAFVFNDYIDSLEEIKIGQQFRARILYIERLKEKKEKVYMNMLHNICRPKPKFNFIIPGFSGKAKIVNVDEQMISLKLGNYCFNGLTRDTETCLRFFWKLKKNWTGSTTAKKQCNNFLVDYEADFYDFMSEKFYCRILNRHKVESSLPSSIALGLRTVCMIESRNRGYLTVLVQYEGVYPFRGIVNWKHYDDEISEENFHLVESSFKLGSLKVCKVLTLHPVLELSLRHSLVKSDNAILSQALQQCYLNPYDGIIEEITSDFLKVKFFGNFACGVPRERVQDGMKCSLKKSYNVGQLVACYIRNYDYHTGDYYMEVKKVE